MRFKTISFMFEYIDWLFRRYNDLKFTHDNKCIYRIIEVKSLSAQDKLIIQVIGKSSIIEALPQDIVADDSFLEGFSQKDVRTITYLACKHISKPKYKILTQDFCDKDSQIVFKLKQQDGDIVIQKTAGQISLDKELINHLNQDDVRSISYAAGYEQALKNQ